MQNQLSPKWNKVFTVNKIVKVMGFMYKTNIMFGMMCAPLWQQLSAQLKMAPIIAFGAVLITAFTTFNQAHHKLIFIMFNSMQLFQLKFKFELQTIYSKVVILFTFGVAINIVNKLIYI